MPSSAASNVTSGPIPDLIGDAAPLWPPESGQPAFDSLLQSPPGMRHLPIDNDPEPTKSLDPPDSRPGAPDSHAPPAEPPTPTVPGNATHDASQSSSDSAQNANKVSTAPPQTGDPAAPDEEPHAIDSFVAESLAGLAIPTPVHQPPAVAPEPTIINDSSPSDPGPAARKSRSPGKKPVAARSVVPNAAQSSAVQSLVPPGRSSKVTAGDAATPTGKPDAYDAVQTPGGRDADDKTAARATVASNLHDDLRQPHDAPRSVPSPSDQQHNSENDNVAKTLSLETRTSTAAGAAPAPATPPAASPQLTLATAVPPVNPSNPPQGIVAAAAQHSRLQSDVLAPSPAATTRRATVEIDSARLLSRVARAFSAAHERDGEIRLRLSPPELGSLRLEVRIHDGALTAHLHTETDAARVALLDNLSALRDRLADQGIHVERFDVDLMQRQPGGMPDQPGGRQHDLPPTPPRVFAAPRSPNDPAGASTLSPISAASRPGGLNVIV